MNLIHTHILCYEAKYLCLTQLTLRLKLMEGERTESDDQTHPPCFKQGILTQIARISARIFLVVAQICKFSC